MLTMWILRWINFYESLQEVSNKPKSVQKGIFQILLPGVANKMINKKNGAICSMKCTPQGAVSIRKMVLPGMAIPMLKIRRPNGRLIFNMEIAIRRLDGLYIETGPR